MARFDLSNKNRSQPPSSDLSLLLGGAVPSGTSSSISQLPLSALDAYPNQPFKPYAEEKLQRLAADIQINGVLSPIIVRPKGTRYEILAGHNRSAASRLAGLSAIPAIVIDADDNTAALVMVNTNLNQRDELSPSEKAFAYKVQLEAMKRKVGRPSNSAQLEPNSKGTRSNELLAKNSTDSRASIQRYIRLTELIPELLQQVDTGELAIISAVALSYLSHEEQRLVLEASADCERKISVFQAEQLKKLAGELNEPKVRELLIPNRSWNPQQEFVTKGRTAIPKTASAEDLEQVLRLIKDYFHRKAV